MAPAGNPCGPHVTSRRNRPSLVSWAKAPSAAIARCWSIVRFRSFDEYRNTAHGADPSSDISGNIEIRASAKLLLREWPIDYPRMTRGTAMANLAVAGEPRLFGGEF